MKPVKLTFFIACSLLCSCLLLGFAQAQEFSADFSSKGIGGKTTGKIFNANYKSRMEVGDIITIAKIDQNKAWVIMLKDKTYMEMPLTSSSFVAGDKNLPGEVERKLLGKETLDGKVVDKYRIVYTAGAKTNVLFSWILPDSGIPVKTVAEDGSWEVEYKNIQLGKQPDDLFELPSGYSKFSMPTMKDVMGTAMEGLSGKLSN
ncbi:MAG: hypothetical protein WC412_02835 [Candidatus Omnitrophota bacterium]|jgi:DNA-binding transcriptional regulator of glucitol operon